MESVGQVTPSYSGRDETTGEMVKAIACRQHGSVLLVDPNGRGYGMMANYQAAKAEMDQVQRPMWDLAVTFSRFLTFLRSFLGVA